jgi:hypothetical protein
VTGRVSALALDPSDSTGGRLYLGTTGGGVWEAQNAGVSDPSLVVFTPLTDAVEALSGATDASISIGALTVQPGGTGVILAGTGDPNDALDSYYGAGILRSTDGGTTWSLIHATADLRWSFAGEGFAGFAWSTANPQLVVAAVSQAYEGTLVNAPQPSRSYQGCITPPTAARTWNLATITDGSGADVQGPNDAFVGSRRQCGHLGGVEPGAAVVCGGGALPRLLPVGGRHHLDADGRAARLRPDGHVLPHQYGLHGLDRLPHLSRRAGGESADRRYLCLDGGHLQPGYRPVA